MFLYHDNVDKFELPSCTTYLFLHNLPLLPHTKARLAGQPGWSSGLTRKLFGYSGEEEVRGLNLGEVSELFINLLLIY